MKNLNRINNFSFPAIATCLIVTAGLAIGVSIPAYRSWQYQNIDKLIEQSKNSNSKNTKATLLAQAALLGKNDPLATYEYAKYLWKAGEYSSSIDTYTESWMKLNYNYLGELALKSGNFSKAKDFYSKANSEGESADSLTGLAIVEFNSNNVAKGCEYSNRAIKLNLSSAKAEQAIAICDIKLGNSKLDSRQQIYKILNAYMYIDALNDLQKLETKNTSDWLAIASIYANTGELGKASSALKNGLEQNPADKVIMQKLIDYLRAEDKNDEAQIYVGRLQDLKFENFPSK